MLIVETIRKIRVAAFRDGKSIREITRELNLSRNTVRKALRSGATEFRYERTDQPRPKLGEHVETLEAWLGAEADLPHRQRRTAMVLFEDLQRQGYQGGYDAVRRFVGSWWRDRTGRESKAFVPLTFEPGEAFQFDWSHEDVEMAGMPVRVKVAHVRLCHSRMMLCVAFPRESLEMVFAGHERAFGLFGGTCRKGIYDNLKTVVQEILVGKDRTFNRRFQQFASHHLFEPVACTPGAGWEKGQVENQVGTVRRRLFVPRLKVTSFEELNRHLEVQCVAYAKAHKHPEFSGRTIWEVFDEERAHLVGVPAAFDGYKESPAKVSTTALVRFDRNRYSVRASEVGKTVAVRAYADRLVFVSDGEVVGEHPREFGRDHTVYDPWHYLEVLERKPGALRNGAPFRQWDLPEPIQEVRQALGGRPDGDRQFVGVLSAVPRYGLEAVGEACREALRARAVSRDVILNLLARLTEEPSPPVSLPCPPRLSIEPVADCRRYDELLGSDAHAA
jgi:transposase